MADTFVAEAERLAARRRGSDPGWLVAARRAALERFDRLGFPTPRDEEWRFTNVAPIAEGRFSPAGDGGSVLTGEARAAFEWRGDCLATLVFVNGRHVAAASQALSLPAGVRVESLARLLSRPESEAETHLTRIANGDGHAFTALNTAFLADGAFVYVPDDVRLAAPIHVLFLSLDEGRPVMAHPRVLVVVGANSRATIVESYGAPGSGADLTNAVTEILVGEGSTLDHYKVQRESRAGFHVGTAYMRVGKDARLGSHSIAFGGALVRNEVSAVLGAEGAECTLNGLYLSDGLRLVDNHTTIDHARPNCASREVYKGILSDRGRAVFNGKIVVRPDAQKTDARQTNKALLLSEDAQINTKPQLEIFANDVKCTHGAAVGQMDEEAIFYLRARGVPEGEARQMLVRAFAADVLNLMPLEPLRSQIEQQLVERLPAWRGR